LPSGVNAIGKFKPPSGDAKHCFPSDGNVPRRLMARESADDVERKPLDELNDRLTTMRDLPSLLDEVLDSIIALHRADFGTLQLYNKERGTLDIAAQRGFDRKFLEYFRRVDVDDGSACGQALKRRSRILIEDVELDAEFTSHRWMAASAGFRAVQSTPLIDRRSSEPIGMLSTHFRNPHRPSDAELQKADLYLRQAADVIALKISEQRLRESETRLQTAADLVGLACYSWNPQTNAVEWDNRLKGMWGLLPEEAVDYKTFIAGVHPEDRARVEAAIAGSADFRGDGIYDIEYRIIGLGDGIERWIATRGRTSFADGKPASFFGVALDITARKQAEDELSRREAELAAILAQIPVGVGVFGRDGGLLRANAQFRRFVRDEYLPSRAFDERWKAFRPDRQPLERLEYPGERALRGETVFPGTDFLHTSEDGVESWLRVASFPFHHPDGEISGTLRVVQDISQEKRTEAEWRRFNETLEHRVAARTVEVAEANLKLRAEMDERARTELRLQELQSELFHAARLSAMGQMAAALAHELSQPLGTAVNFGNAARRLLDSGQHDNLDTARTHVDAAVAQVLRAAQIMRRLQDFVSQGETDKRVENMEQIIADATALALIGPEILGMEVSRDLGADAALVFVDRIQIQQVLVNLIRNAVEAMAGRELRSLRVTSRLVAGEIVEVSTIDNGPGLPQAVLGRLFQPFVTTRRDGMGLGLSICRTIVEAHSGRLWAEPNPNGGTIFRFTVPASLRVEMADGG
jgi:two-component system sensor kinase FixL